MWNDADEARDEKSLITFNEDHMEHMDYLAIDKYQEVLKKNKAKGIVAFGCLDGDQFGQFWGYEFDGKGNMFELKGSLNWKRN